MGDKGDPPHAFSPSAGYDAFHSHGSSSRINSEVFLQAALRNIHRPDTVTWIKAEDCDILGFAEAGHANARKDDSDETYAAIRKYKVPARSLDEPQGSVTDDILFARWQYEWNGRSMPCYKLKWVDDWGWHVREYYAVVTDGTSMKDGHCSFTEELIKTCGAWTQKLHDEVYMYEDGDWQKNKELFKAVVKASWDDVIIKPAMKTDIINDVDSFFGARATYQEYNIPWKRGVILHGPPGCGKTISIKALMNTVRHQGVANLYVKSFKASGCQSDQASIRQIFTKARAVAPALLIFEDLDSLVTDELRSFFLNEVDGVEENNGILIIGSTNHLDRLDTSITKRPSRFDRKYHFEPPSEPERLLYCQYWQQKLSANPAIDFTEEICQAVAALTDGFTFAYLKEVFVQSLLIHARGRADDAVTDSGPETPSKTKRTEQLKEELTTTLKTSTFFRTLCRQIDALVEDLGVGSEEVAGKEESEDQDGKEAVKPAEAEAGKEGDHD
jgi:transitional endoplasmic reticulum ATPase